MRLELVETISPPYKYDSFSVPNPNMHEAWMLPVPKL